MYNNTTKVPILIPPAVDALPPPMNMRMEVTNHEVGCIWLTSKELKPAVRGITDANRLSTLLCSGVSEPKVFGLSHSIKAIATVPIVTNAKLAQSTILEFSDHCFGIV